MKQEFSNAQKEFATEVQKQFTFEELALCFYDNECYYCNSQRNCDGYCSTKECVDRIRQVFENRYLIESEVDNGSKA